MIEMDTVTLDKIANLTGTGSASLATSTEQFKAVLNKIDMLEKSRYKVRYYYDYKEVFPFFLWLAWIFLLLELVLRFIIIKVLPE
jgi:Ca-activated chloride channel family protein